MRVIVFVLALAAFFVPPSWARPGLPSLMADGAILCLVVGVLAWRGWRARAGEGHLGKARRMGWRLCPEGGYDPRGSPETGQCAECGQAHSPASLFDGWETRGSDSELRRTWPPIAGRRVELPWWGWTGAATCAVSLLLTISSGGVTFFGRAVAGVPARSLIVLTAAYATRGVSDWRGLRQSKFRHCPRCLRGIPESLSQGRGVRCGMTYGPSWLERTWCGIYDKREREP